MGCDMAQGYFIGRPMSFTALEEMMEARRKAA
jgi:EAL domain-containing protein (putative c-di-GMP-specific phosphodiesterase class I)